MTLELTPSPAPESPKTVRFYLGDGNEYYAGVPARDLSEDDWALLGDAQRELVDRGHVTGSRAIDAHDDVAPKYEEIRTRLYQKTKPAPRKEG